MRLKRNKGFTLVELLVIIGIIVLLAAVVIPITVGVLDNSNATQQTEWVAELQGAVESYKSVKVENTNEYPRLYRETKNGYNESAAFLNNAGHGNIPGYTIELINEDNSTKTAETIYDEIRRDFMSATKAFTDIDVKENYYLTDNAKSKEESFVYYYLTGDVKRQRYDELKYYEGTSTEGEINTDEFWVFLTLPEKFQEGHETETGSGYAGLINDTDNDGKPNDPKPGEKVDNTYLNFYVKVVDFATGEPISAAQGETITVRLVGNETRRADVGESGIVFFQKVKSGTYTVEVKSDKNNWLSYPDDTIYVEPSEKGGLVVITRSVKEDGTLTRYIGDYIQNPYVVRMKRGTLGSMEFTQLVPKWNGSEWVSERETITDGTIVTVDFTTDTTDPLNTARPQKYIFDTVNKTLPLLNGSQYLTFGEYSMSVTTSKDIFYPVNKQIVSELWGIDDLPDGRYDEIAPYTYVLDLKRQYSKFSGSLIAEETEQILTGTPNEDGKLGYWDDNSTLKAQNIKTIIKLKQGGTVVFSTQLDEEGKFSIEGIPDGTYDIEISDEYNNSFVPADFPRQITTEGGLYTAEGTMKDADYVRTNLTVNVLFKDNNDPIQNAKVTLQRFGESATSTQTVGTNGQTVFTNIKTGFYQLSYTVPYNNTIYYAKVFVGTSGKVITLYPTLLNSTLTFKVQDEYGVTTNLPNGNVRLVLTNIETNTTYAVKTIKVPTNGIVTFTARVGTYKIEILADNHYITKTVWSNSFKAFDSTKGNLTPFVRNYGTKIIKFDISSETPHAGKVVYKKGSSSMTASADFVSNVKHERYCTACGYHWIPENCVFDNTIAANVSSIAGEVGNTKHRVKCKTCLINTEDQVHDFSGNYRNSTPHTQTNNGTHARACLYCPDNGYDGDRRNVDNCSNTTIIEATTHTYKCNECGNTTGGSTTYNHNYAENASLPNKGYQQVAQKTSAITGTHNLPCSGCDSRGWGKTKDAVGNCSNKETITSTQHKHECVLCNNQITENHNFNGIYKNVDKHTQINNGTHYRACANCTGYGFNGVLNATENCGNDTTAETNKHVFTCPLCKSYTKYDHNYTGAVQNVIPHTTKTNGTHNYKCDVCGTYGFNNVLNGTEACAGYDVTEVYETQHSVKCTKCNSETKEDHNFSSSPKNVTEHTAVDNGTHQYYCVGCQRYGVGNVLDATEACTNVTTKQATTHTYTCPTCKSAKSYNHNFSGAVKNKVAHTTKSNGEHYWLCTGCDGYGYNGTWNNSVKCENETTAQSTTHTYTCPTCGSNKSYNHNYSENIQIKTAYTSSGYGTHDAACTGCNSRGWGSTKDSKANCPSTGHKLNSSTHYFECTTCNNYAEFSHSMSNRESGGDCVTYSTIYWDCDYCSYGYDTQGSKKPNNHKGPCREQTVVARSCFTDGSYKTVCQACGTTTDTRTESAYGSHNYGGWIQDTAATCTTEGTKHKTCSRCGAVENGTIPKLSHNYIGKITTAATCTKSGIKTYTCSKCGDSYTETISSPGHQWGSGVISKGNCMAAKKTTYKCKVCGATKTTTGSKDPSNHVGTTTSKSNPICPYITVTTVKCTGCGAQISKTTTGSHKYNHDITCVNGCGFVVCRVCACGANTPDKSHNCPNGKPSYPRCTVKIKNADGTYRTCGGAIINGVCQAAGGHPK